eukprot:g824.t1
MDTIVMKLQHSCIAKYESSGVAKHKIFSPTGQIEIETEPLNQVFAVSKEFTFPCNEPAKCPDVRRKDVKKTIRDKKCALGDDDAYAAHCHKKRRKMVDKTTGELRPEAFGGQFSKARIIPAREEAGDRHDAVNFLQGFETPGWGIPTPAPTGVPTSAPTGAPTTAPTHVYPKMDCTMTQEEWDLCAASGGCCTGLNCIHTNGYSATGAICSYPAEGDKLRDAYVDMKKLEELEGNKLATAEYKRKVVEEAKLYPFPTPSPTSCLADHITLARSNRVAHRCTDGKPKQVVRAHVDANSVSHELPD